MGKPERIHAYKDVIMDSERWDAFHPRNGDIIVATPAKCGTTWTQMICALLVHQSAELPLPLTKLSRWMDRHTEPAEKVAADFDAQPWRRIVKTHTPLDGLPYWEGVHYVFCGRDPRDAYLSMMDQLLNVSPETMADARKRGGFPDDFAFPNDPNQVFPIWLTTGHQPWMWDGWPAGSCLYLSNTYWQHRDLANLTFLHYSDLTRDREREMRRLAKALGIAVNEDKWPALVEAAGFAAMKAKASDNAPGAHLGEWTSDSNFFPKARNAEWRAVLTEENQALYEKVSAERLEPDLKRWLEGGNAAFDPN